MKEEEAHRELAVYNEIYFIGTAGSTECTNDNNAGNNNDHGKHITDRDICSVALPAQGNSDNIAEWIENPPEEYEDIPKGCYYESSARQKRVFFSTCSSNCAFGSAGQGNELKPLCQLRK